MRLSFIFATFTLIAGPSFGQGMSEEDCNNQAQIVTVAKELRQNGVSAEDAIAEMGPRFEGLGSAYVDQIIPALVSQYVYAQSDAALDQDLAGAWKQACLTTDLSAVLGSQ